MTKVTVAQVGPEAAPVVIGLVERLLRELGEEGGDSGPLDAPVLSTGWRAEESRHRAFVAYGDDGGAVGVVTVVEAFALYAGGRYGIINELYVVPAHRSSGVGARLVEAVKELGRTRGWRRVDVAAPASERWSRTRRFYEREGFALAGPKLKFLLS